jgi:hypothetical protein
MYRRRASGVVLTALLGLLALAPAPAAAAGATVLPAGGDAPTGPKPVVSNLQHTSDVRQRILPTHPATGTMAGAARAEVRLRPTLPGGIGANVQVSPTTTSDRFSETAVTIDPGDASGHTMLAESNFLTGSTMAVFVSTTNGASWTQERGIAGGPNQAFVSDPGTADDTGGPTGPQRYQSFIGVSPQGSTELEVVRDEQLAGGPVLIDPTNDPDKPMIATDPHSTGEYVGYDTNPPGATTGQPLMVRASHDQGTSWAAPVTVWNSGGDFGAWPAVAGDGTVYMVWDDYCGDTPTTLNQFCPRLNGQILLSRSTDGGVTWSSTPTAIAQTTTGFGSILPNYAPECTQGCPARFVNPSPQIAIDHSGGTRDGTLYVVYGDGSDRRTTRSTAPSTNRMHIFLQESKDGGATWSSRIRIDSGNPNDAWQPSVAVDQTNGNVVVTWYDRRDDGSNHLYVPYFTESLSDSNSLAQFTAQLPVADTQSDPQVDCNGTGDYLQIAAASGTAHPVWTDSRSGLPAVFSSAIDEATAATSTSTRGTGSSAVRPSAGTGWLSLPGGGTDIGVGANCTAWIIGEDAVTGGGGTWVFEGSRGWVNAGGGGVRITTSPFGGPRLVNNSGQVWFLGAAGWTQLNGGGLDAGAGPDNSLWLIGLDPETGGHGVWVFNGSGFTFANGAGVRIAIGPDGLPWIVNNAGQIWHLDLGAWVQVPGGARDIGVGADGSVWIIGLNPIAGGWQTYRFNGSGGWDAVNGGGVAISVGPDGMPWVINSAGQIFERV